MTNVRLLRLIRCVALLLLMASVTNAQEIQDIKIYTRDRTALDADTAEASA